MALFFSLADSSLPSASSYSKPQSASIIQETPAPVPVVASPPVVSPTPSIFDNVMKKLQQPPEPLEEPKGEAAPAAKESTTAEISSSKAKESASAVVEAKEAFAFSNDEDALAAGANSDDAASKPSFFDNMIQKLTAAVEPAEEVESAGTDEGVTAPIPSFAENILQKLSTAVETSADVASAKNDKVTETKKVGKTKDNESVANGDFDKAGESVAVTANEETAEPKKEDDASKSSS